MLQFCRQRQELQRACRRAMSSLKTIVGLANPDVFQSQPPFLAAQKHAAKNGFTHGTCINLLQSPFLARKKSSVPLCDFATTGGRSATPPDWFSWPQQCCTICSAVWADVQRPCGKGSSPAPAAGCLSSPVPDGMLEQHTQCWQGASSWRWRSKTDSS